MASHMMTNFPRGFANGLMVRGLPILQTNPGRIFWLYNGTVLEPGEVAGSDSNRGSYYRPFNSLAGALLQCTAGAGDIIMVKPGHAETISSSTALTMSVADVAVVGLGGGTNRPSFTLDTANTATINVTANNVSFQNCQFIGNFLAIASLFTLTTAKYFSISQCEIRDTSASLNFLVIATTNTTSNAADGLSITDSVILSSATSGVVNLVTPAGTNDRWQIIGNYYAALTTGTGAAIAPIAAGKVLTNLLLDNNVISVQQTTGVTTGILITTNGSTNSGMISRNLIQGLDATTEILVTASSGFLFSQNYYSGAADKSGYLLPAADS